MLKLLVVYKDGKEEALLYDPIKPSIIRQDGSPLITSEKSKNLFSCYSSSGQHWPPHEVRLCLGRACNYRCSYCHQASGEYKNVLEHTMNDNDLVNAISERIGNEYPIHFWGGEPLVYFEQIKKFTYLFKEKGFKEFSIITNGGLLTEEKVNFLIENNFFVVLSHDGPGQHLRSGNPLEDATLLQQVKRLASREGRFLINPVFTVENKDHALHEKYISDILEEFNISYGESSQIMVTDEQSMQCSIPDDALYDYSKQLYIYMYKSALNAIPYATYRGQAKNFIESVCDNSGIVESGYCAGVNENAIIVDMAGNLLTCQSFTAKDKTYCGESFAMGHITSSKESLLRPKPIKWYERKKCKGCPVVYFCRGGCPYQAEDKYFEITCKGRMHHFMAILGYSVSLMTDGALLVECQKSS